MGRDNIFVPGIHGIDLHSYPVYEEAEMRISYFPHVEHLDCPACAVKDFIQIAVYDKTTNPNCKTCGGEGVIREDGKPTLKTRVVLICT